MKYKRVIAVSTAISILSLSLSSLAYGADASVSNTGPDSTNNVSIEQKNTVTVDNTNNVLVVNAVDQSAKTGNAKVSENTTGGSATTGAATNNSSSSTVVSINNANPVASLGNPGAGGAGTPGGGGGPSTGGTGSLGSGGATSRIGGAGGAGGVGGVQMLPKTGPNDKVDVSALRNQDLSTQAAVPQLVNKSNSVSVMLLIVAAILSLVGAAGSAIYAMRQKRMA